MSIPAAVKRAAVAGGLLLLALFPARMTLAGGLSLSSADIKPGGTIAAPFVFKGFGCEGENRSPALAWNGAPPGTRSFALTVHDPDAPTGSGFWHWVVYDIPADASSLPQGAGAADGKALPAGARQGITDFGAPGYGGPCPPPGHEPHRYVFTLHALKVEKLDVPANATPGFVGFFIHSNEIGRARLTGRYGR